MRPNIIYNLRILVLETYIRITMIGYESKVKKYAEKFGGEGSLYRQLHQEGHKT